MVQLRNFILVPLILLHDKLRSINHSFVCRKFHFIVLFEVKRAYGLEFIFMFSYIICFPH